VGPWVHRRVTPCPACLHGGTRKAQRKYQPRQPGPVRAVGVGYPRLKSAAPAFGPSSTFHGPSASARCFFSSLDGGPGRPMGGQPACAARSTAAYVASLVVLACGCPPAPRDAGPIETLPLNQSSPLPVQRRDGGTGGALPATPSTRRGLRPKSGRPKRRENDRDGRGPGVEGSRATAERNAGPPPPAAVSLEMSLPLPPPPDALGRQPARSKQENRRSDSLPALDRRLSRRCLCSALAPSYPNEHKLRCFREGLPVGWSSEPPPPAAEC